MSETPDSLLCPSCGFDLRGTPGDRCGECGLQFDRESLAESGIPWAHRREIGRGRAYLRTVWRFTFRSASLLHETARPQDWRDARTFAWITSFFIAVALGGSFAALATAQGSLRFLDLVDLQSRAVWTPAVSTRWVDFALPWSAGATLWPVIPICLILFSIYLTGVPRSVIEKRSFDQPRRARAAAFAYYSTAPFALLFPASLLACPAFWFNGLDSRYAEPLPQMAVLTTLLAIITVAVSLVFSIIRVGQWARRTQHSQFGGTLYAIVQTIVLCLFGVLVIGGLFPWCVGFFRIVIETFG